jgi:hypothetical protein
MSNVPFKTLSLAGVLLLAAAEAQGATTWRFDVPPPGTDPCSQSSRVSSSSPLANNFGNNIFCTPVGGGAPTVTATAWANSAGTASNTAGATSLENAYITVYQNSTGTSPSGIGITNRLAGTTADPGETTSPEHAIDNNGANAQTGTGSVYADADNGRYDMVLLDFSTRVNLTGLSIGWFSNDVDITVMAFNPTTALQTASLAGKKYTELTTSGWSIVGHYANLATANTVYNFAGRSNSQGTDSVNAANTSIQSRYWLIGAYNPTVGAVGSSNTNSGLNAGNDYFKLLSVVGNPASPPAPPGGVPEPASLALIFASAVGFGALRARRRK